VPPMGEIKISKASAWEFAKWFIPLVASAGLWLYVTIGGNASKNAVDEQRLQAVEEAVEECAKREDIEDVKEDLVRIENDANKGFEKVANGLKEVRDGDRDINNKLFQLLQKKQ